MMTLSSQDMLKISDLIFKCFETFISGTPGWELYRPLWLSRRQSRSCMDSLLENENSGLRYSMQDFPSNPSNYRCRFEFCQCKT